VDALNPVEIRNPGRMNEILFEKRSANMKLRITQVILTTAAVMIFALAAPPAFAQQDTQGKPTAKGQMKESGREVVRAGKSLGHNVKHGRILRGGKRFGKHIGYAGRHVGRGTKHAVKTAVKP
jgi:hypothetical protein